MADRALNVINYGALISGLWCVFCAIVASIIHIPPHPMYFYITFGPLMIFSAFSILTMVRDYIRDRK